MRKDIKYWVWLSSIPQIGAVKCSRLLEYFGKPENVWYASEVDLKELTTLNKTDRIRLRDEKIKEGVEKHLENLYRHNIGVITIHDPNYPQYLKNTYDPPVLLYIKGSMQGGERMVAVVGSRKASDYGLSMAESLSKELAALGITVISGMARGVDSKAHYGALKVKGRTIAVLGCGLDIAYPAENEELMKRIAVSGAVISEYPPGSPPIAQSFPARNRIISGCSIGVVVIEAGDKSGSLITADFALEQGREVFAVPGNINSQYSRGTNKLIKEGATIVTCIDDILEELNVFKNANNNAGIEYNGTAREQVLKGLEDDERKIVVNLLDGSLHIDILAARSGISSQMTNSLLIMLELKGIVEQMPGKIFKLKV